MMASPGLTSTGLASLVSVEAGTNTDSCANISVMALTFGQLKIA